MTMTSGYAKVPGGTVWYGIYGVGRPGTPLVVLHGGPGVPHDYLLPLTELADVRPVIFYDQLGCGLSVCADNPDDWTVENSVAGLHALCHQLGLKRYILLGQSWGTFLAVSYALAHPEARPAGLILADPCLSAPRWINDMRGFLRQMPCEDLAEIEHCEMTGDYQSPAYQRIMERFYHQHVCKCEPWPQVVMDSFERANQSIYRHMWGASEFSVTGTLKDRDLCGQLGKLRMPVLYLCGRDDEATPETTRHYCRCTPGATMTVIENASHLPHLEQPGPFFTAVREFLISVENDNDFTIEIK